MMTKRLFLFTMLLLASLSMTSQSLTILDQDSQAAIESVALISQEPRAFGVTNAQGQVDITEFKGASEIQIRSLGYKMVVLSYAALENKGFEILLESTNLNLDEVVVSATRWRQSSNHVPSKIVSISAKEVTLQNPQTAADLLTLSGKVFVQKSQQGGGSPMIRGFATNRLLYTVDGVRMNNAIFRGGNIQNVISLDPFATESTEVLFGPGSVIYGSDAIGGVMSYQTLTPKFSLDDKTIVTGKIVTRYSSANQEKTGHFDVNVGWKKWALVTSFSSWDYDHLRQGSNGPDDYLKPYYVQRQDTSDVLISQDDPLLQIPSAYSQINVMQKVRFMPTSDWEFNYGFHYSETSTYGRYDRHNRVKEGTARYAEWNYGPQKWMMNNLHVSNSRKTGIYDEVSIQLALQEFEESRIDRSLNQAGRRTQDEEVLAYSVNVDFIKAKGEKHTFNYGVEFVRNDVASNGKIENIFTGFETIAPARYPMSTWTSLGFYVNDDISVSEKTSIQAGLRYNEFAIDADFDTTFYPFPFTTASLDKSSLTGSVGMVHRPSDTWVLSTNLGTAFRAPNIDDIGKIFDSEPGIIVVPNPELDAEYAYNLDLSVAKVFDELVKVDFTAFYTFLQDALVRRDFLLNGQDSLMYDGELSRVQAMQNAASADVYGIQIGLEVNLPEGFSFSTDLNYQVGDEELDDGSISPSRHAAPLYGVSRLKFKAQKLNMQVYVMAQAERAHEDLALEEQSKTEIYAKDENGNTYAPSWYTLNLKAMYDLSKHFALSSGIENITDQRYRPYSSGISGAGRNFYLSLKANF